MSLKERLAAKQRRTVIVPVQISDPGPAREVYEQADRQATLLQLTVDAGDDDGSKDRAALKRRLTNAKKARDEARADYLEHFEEVRFLAASPAEVERVLGAHLDADGNWDESTACGPLAALCAEDEELRDEQWWTEQLASGTWSPGEHGRLWTSLLSINVTMPPEALPKG
ncbi:hypothetical protein ACFQHV_00970 [Promicromonospora thailandica]|uniref:Uncharacterized protein n=1 Tax=Promicromonospora thailandica TaxID=765201 RepID=A0A9X2G2E1_9MICO|nr:hypothetical protein [Promicromonospora thailandica]MCP2265574.1 hypothetical protein [Promicromonospora thailandica]BFF17137.1 hypothetical protein GCM10025730_06580 [Promicromonospora thailandica]